MSLQPLLAIDHSLWTIINSLDDWVEVFSDTDDKTFRMISYVYVIMTIGSSQCTTPGRQSII